MLISFALGDWMLRFAENLQSVHCTKFIQTVKHSNKFKQFKIESTFLDNLSLIELKIVDDADSRTGRPFLPESESRDAFDAARNSRHTTRHSAESGRVAGSPVNLPIPIGLALFDGLALSDAARRCKATNGAIVSRFRISQLSSDRHSWFSSVRHLVKSVLNFIVFPTTCWSSRQSIQWSIAIDSTACSLLIEFSN